MYKIIKINDILTYIWKFLGLNHNISMSDFYARFALSFGRKNGLHFFFCVPLMQNGENVASYCIHFQGNCHNDFLHD